jgi:hypothetical protein
MGAPPLQRGSIKVSINSKSAARDAVARGLGKSSLARFSALQVSTLGTSSYEDNGDRPRSWCLHLQETSLPSRAARDHSGGNVMRSDVSRGCVAVALEMAEGLGVARLSPWDCCALDEATCASNRTLRERLS